MTVHGQIQIQKFHQKLARNGHKKVIVMPSHIGDFTEKDAANQFCLSIIYGAVLIITYKGQ